MMIDGIIIQKKNNNNKVCLPANYPVSQSVGLYLLPSWNWSESLFSGFVSNIELFVVVVVVVDMNHLINNNNKRIDIISKNPTTTTTLLSSYLARVHRRNNKKLNPIQKKMIR